MNASARSSQPDVSRIRAALLSALLGDALGVPYEFKAAQDLPPLALIEMEPPAGFRRTHHGTPVGTWSDDGALMLALLDALHASVPLDIELFARNMLAWYDDCAYTPDGRLFDIGVQTRDCLRRMRDGVHPLQAAEAAEHQNGNGSLMRVLPVAFLAASDAELVATARLQSRPTHAHVRSQLACAAYVLIVRELLLGADKNAALRTGCAKLLEHTPVEEHGEYQLVCRLPDKVLGSGYVVDSFWSAWQAFETAGDVRSCLQQAVALGKDTDTTACIAGGLAGAHYGWDAVPVDWLRLLQGQELVNTLLGQFLARP